MSSNATRAEKIYLLSKYICEENYYETLIDARNELEKESTLSAVSYDRPPVQTGPGDPANQYIEKFDRIKKLDCVITAQRGTTDKALDTLEEIIQGIDGARAQRIFRLRYVCGYDWKKISIHMGLSEPSLYRIHGNVLDQQIDVDSTGKLIVK